MSKALPEAQCVRYCTFIVSNQANCFAPEYHRHVHVPFQAYPERLASYVLDISVSLLSLPMRMKYDHRENVLTFGQQRIGYGKAMSKMRYIFARFCPVLLYLWFGI